MSSAPQPPDVPPDVPHEAPKKKDYRIPGLRGAQTTTLFRAVNPELFIKPVREQQLFGAADLNTSIFLPAHQLHSYMAVAITSEELFRFGFSMIYEPSLYVLDL